MEAKSGLRMRMLRWLVVPVIALAVLTVFLTWDGPQQQPPAEAASGGPEMRLAVTGSTACPPGTPAGYICVAASANFTLKVAVIARPTEGYILAQAFIDYGTFNPTASEDGAGPGTCNDGIDNGGGDGADRFDLNPSPTGNCVSKPLVYTPAASASTEIVWPDCLAATALRNEAGRGLVSHGCLTGILPPQPASTYTGDIISLAMKCSAAFTTTTVRLLAEGDPIAGTSGALFAKPGGVQVVPKVGNKTIRCLGPTPTPTFTNQPTPTHTPTPSNTPTPTNTFTQAPPPSDLPDVQVTKVDLTDPVEAGAEFTYRVRVESVGLQTVTGVTVTDTLPPGTTFVPPADPFSFTHTASCSHLAGVVTCSITRIGGGTGMATGEAIRIDIKVIAPVPAEDTRISNTVTVQATNELVHTLGNNKDIEETVILAPRSDVTLNKVGVPTFIVNAPANVQYTLEAINNGPHAAQNVVITDTLPPGTQATFVSASAQCGAPSGGQVVCNMGKIQPGGNAIATITLTALPVTQDALLKNSARVSADNELFMNTGNNLATDNTPIIAPPPQLVVTKDDSQDKVLRLGFFSYIITVQNQGGGDALNVTVSDTLPTSSVQIFQKFIRHTKFISAVGATCAQVGNSDKIQCTLPIVNANSQVQITLNVRAPTILVSQTVTNNVNVSTPNPFEPPEGNQDSETTQIKACFDVNGDLIVDLANDIFETIQHYGLYSTDPGFDTIYDFDGDGFIGLANDILPVIQNYLQDCSLLLL